jgi:hypothetical protein
LKGIFDDSDHRGTTDAQATARLVVSWWTDDWFKILRPGICSSYVGILVWNRGAYYGGVEHKLRGLAGVIQGVDIQWKAEIIFAFGFGMFARRDVSELLFCLRTQ